MREIRFRVRIDSTILGWEKLTDGEWFWAKMTMNGDVGKWRPGVFSVPGSARDEFTGLKDKPGVEIYEGDIVKTPSYPGDQVSEVVFLDGSFAIYLDGTKLRGSDDSKGRGWIEISQYSYSTDDDFEVIGHIYESKGLGEQE